METINNNYHQLARYQLNNQEKIKPEAEIKNSSAFKKEQLNKTAQEFTSIFIEKMFASMKKTLADDKMVDGGYAEDVFSDMLYKEYSQMAGKQGVLADLNRTLVKQLQDAQS